MPTLPPRAPAKLVDDCQWSAVYADKGGDLDRLELPRDVPDETGDCAGRTCRVDGRVAAVVEKDGSVRDIIVEMTDDTGASTVERSERMRQWLSLQRFEPPRLGDVPVCVHLEWSFWFAKKEPVNTQPHTP
jgi:hypothetical protein